MEHITLKKALGNVIYELRREKKLSQEKLATEANVDRTRTGEIERGEANPTMDTLIRIADVLGYTLGMLIIRAEMIAYEDSIKQEVSHKHLPSSIYIHKHDIQDANNEVF